MMHRCLESVDKEKEFHVHDGARLRNLHDLAIILDVIEDKDFDHHVTPHRNDFSTWVSEVIGDVELADELLRKHTAHHMAASVKKRIRELNVMRRHPTAKHLLTARIKEFLLGMVFGYIIGMFLAKVIGG
ncbi:MAG: hypothetical protein KJ709_04625 [Nanoarchaeota archaeon]|nr:hypothetical protein [Nanoarchaeota archaeon]